MNACNTNAEKLKAKGMPFSFDMEYNSQFPVKSRKSYESKVERSKSFTVYDPIRDTVYCSDPYDLSNLEAFLQEQRASGYIVAPIDVPIEKMMKKGYIPTPEEIESGIKTVKVPDIDTYIQKSEQKTAVLFESTLKSCVLLAEEEYTEKMSEFAFNFGLAFQIKNDLKDYLSAEKNDENDGIYNAPFILSDEKEESVLKTKELLDNHIDCAKQCIEELSENIYKSGLIELLELLRDA